MSAINKTVEELLAVLEGDQDEPLKYTDDILGFISVYGLKPGRKPVSLVILYKLYKNWSKTPVKQSVFRNRFSQYFALTRNKSKSYFNLSESAFDIAGEMIEKLAREEKKLIGHFVKTVQRFLFKNGVKRGTYWIERYVIYTTYVNWIYDNKITSYARFQDFGQIMDLLFDKRTKNQIDYFAVNEELKETLLTPSRVSAIQRWHNAHKAQSEKEKTKQKKSK